MSEPLRISFVVIKTEEGTTTLGTDLGNGFVRYQPILEGQQIVIEIRRESVVATLNKKTLLYAHPHVYSV